MQISLRNWGLSNLLPRRDQPRDSNHQKPPRPAKPRKARGSGPVEDLPPASAATPLFREKLDLLGRANEDLKYRKEKSQAGRFFSSMVDTSPQVVRREEWSDEEWAGLANQHNFDASADAVSIENGLTFRLGGGTYAPSAPLPALIATYVLAGGEVGPLLRLLHRGALSQDKLDQISERIEGKKNRSGGSRDGLKDVAGQLARLVRGLEIPTGGTRKPRVTNLEFSLECRITERRKAGVPDDQIYEDLRRFALSGANKELTRGEFRRLAERGSRWPWT